MAKFCSRCGKKLEDGMVCDCAPVVTEVADTDIKESFLDCLGVLKGIFTKPFDTIKKFVTENKFITGIILIAIAALLSGVYKIAVLKNLYSASSIDSISANDLVGMLSSALSGSALAEPSYLKEFFTTFALSLVEYALIAGVGYLLLAKLLKAKTSFKQVISAVGVSLSVVIVAFALNSILAFIDGSFVANLRSYVTAFTGILSTLILCTSVKHISKIDDNKLFLSVASMSVVATIVIDILNNIINK